VRKWTLNSYLKCQNSIPDAKRVTSKKHMGVPPPLCSPKVKKGSCRIVEHKMSFYFMYCTTLFDDYYWQKIIITKASVVWKSVQYVHCVMQTCITVKLGGNEKHKSMWKTRKCYEMRGEILKIKRGNNYFADIEIPFLGGKVNLGWFSTESEYFRK